jgi:peptidoglycan/xylan/chitin deacetylase (PgdA/CDA1 family)
VSGQDCLVVMYHYIRDSAATPFPAIRALTPGAFEQQLDWLQREYTVIDVDRFEAAIGGRATLPANAALLTFDDGFADHFETAFPILRARGLSGVFFLTQDAAGASPRMLGVHKTHFLLARLGPDAFGRAVLETCAAADFDAARRARVFGADSWDHADERAIKNLLNYELPFEDAERVLDVLFAAHIGDRASFARSLYLDEDAIRTMARGGMRFGYHTRSHRMLSRLDAAGQRSELRDGVAWIRRLTGQASVSFCYPWGGPGTYTAETVRMLAETGYSIAFNTVRRRTAVGVDGRFELPRVDTRDLPPYTGGEPAAAAAARTEHA